MTDEQRINKKILDAAAILLSKIDKNHALLLNAVSFYPDVDGIVTELETLLTKAGYFDSKGCLVESKIDPLPSGNFWIKSSDEVH